MVSIYFALRKMGFCQCRESFAFSRICEILGEYEIGVLHGVCHELTLAHRESKWSTSFKPLILGRVCHSRMLLAGIQAEFELDPRLKHSGVTILGSRISSPQPQFSKEAAIIAKLKISDSGSLRVLGREKLLRGSFYFSFYNHLKRTRLTHKETIQ
jgi:hypothetical protein